MKRNKISRNKFTLLLAVVTAAALAVTGCSAGSSGNAGSSSSLKTLRIGFNPGPYQEEFQKGIAPILEKKGYKITYTNFTDGIQPDVALSTGQIDANVMQHTIWLESINQKEKIKNIGIVLVPTPPMGLYSKKHKSLAYVTSGTTVVLPNDAQNMLRALKILQAIGWIKLNSNIDPQKTALSDVISNPDNIKFVLTDSAQGPQALNDADYVAIQGNYAIANNLKLTSALKLEDMTDPYTNTVAINFKNKNSQFAKDIVEAYRSAEFIKYIKSNSKYDGYHLPSFFSSGK